MFVNTLTVTVTLTVLIRLTHERLFGDTLENICDTQMCRDNRFENLWIM
jgi:hypothetical protein